MKIIKRVFQCVTILCLLTMAGCAQTTSTSATPSLSITVASLQEYYPSLLEEAQRWRADAYLESVRIFLYPEHTNTIISAGFFSPSEDFESFGVDVAKNGNIISESYAHQYPILHRAPITEADWRIDSSAALELMVADEESLRFVNSGQGRCSNLWLRRIVYLENQPIIWSLSLWDCADFQKLLYLDANSGSLIDSAIINVQPTRRPSPIP